MIVKKLIRRIALVVLLLMALGYAGILGTAPYDAVAASRKP